MAKYIDLHFRVEQLSVIARKCARHTSVDSIPLDGHRTRGLSTLIANCECEFRMRLHLCGLFVNGCLFCEFAAHLPRPEPQQCVGRAGWLAVWLSGWLPVGPSGRNLIAFKEPECHYHYPLRFMSLSATNRHTNSIIFGSYNALVSWPTWTRTWDQQGQSRRGWRLENQKQQQSQTDKQPARQAGDQRSELQSAFRPRPQMRHSRGLSGSKNAALG